MESASYNSRLQPLSLSLSAGLWQLQYEYTRAGANNNGNVLKQTLTAAGMAAITTTYKYDGANRLKTAAEQPADGTIAPTCSSPASVLANGWCQEYEYDVWGNRRIAMRVNDGVGVEPSSFNPATNRISDAGWEYAANEARGVCRPAIGPISFVSILSSLKSRRWLSSAGWKKRN